jgi:transcriptional regulator with XRE-family HTH domain
MNSIKELREGAGLSQAALADKLGGVHFNTIKNWEQGNSEPRSSDLIKLADVFGVSIERVMGLHD